MGHEINMLSLERRIFGVLSCGKQMRYTFAITIKGRVKVEGFRYERRIIIPVEVQVLILLKLSQNGMGCFVGQS